MLLVVVITLACKLLALFLSQVLFHTCRPSAADPAAEADTGNVEVGEECQYLFLRPDGALRTIMAARKLILDDSTIKQ